MSNPIITTQQRETARSGRRRSFDLVILPLLIILALNHFVIVEAAVTTAGEARRFGVAESLLAKSSKSGWKVECSETSDDFFERYRDLDEVYKFLKTDLRAKFPGSATKSIGTTSQNRQILSIRIGPASAEKVVLAMAGLHGREWTSIAALLFAVNGLSVDDLPENTALVVVPIANPDGYVKTFDGGTHTKERFKQGVGIERDEDQPNRYWRKNGAGVDLNRNFGHEWGNDSKKSNKLTESDVYQGTGPYSEKETQALRDWAEVNADRLAAIIDFHCCIGAILAPPYPAGTSRVSAEENESVGRRIVEALSEGGKGVTRTVKGGDGVPGAYEWRARSPKDVGAGLSASWGFVELVVDLTYVVEMRGKFVAPCWEIRQLGKEALMGLRALLKEVGDRPQRSLKERKQMRYAPSSSSLRAAGAYPTIGGGLGGLLKGFGVLTIVSVGVLIYLVNVRGVSKVGWIPAGILDMICRMSGKRSNGKE